MSNIFPTDYSTKTTPDGTDVVWSSDAVTNFNLTIASIALYTLTNADTDDIVEGVNNLYYTDDRVSSNSTVVSLGTNKADKTNVLELDNTTPYTPTAQYHPVTKDYADNMGTNVNGLTEKVTVDNNDEFLIYDSVGLTNKKLKNSTLKENVDAYSKEISVVNASIPMINTAGTYSIAHGLGRTPKKLTFYCQFSSNTFINLNYGLNSGVGVYSGIVQDPTGGDSFEFTNTLLYKYFTDISLDKYVQITIQSIDSTNIVFNRTINNSPNNGDDLLCNIISE